MFDDNPNDYVEAYFCSTNDEQNRHAYEELKQVRQCSENARDANQLALCIGTPALSPKQRYFLGCVQNNQGDMAGVAVCGLSHDLTPEQTVALSCAVTAAPAGPHVYAACVGGRIAAVEFQKCWQGGIAVEGGCFGPNSEFRKLARSLDGYAKRAMGENSIAYKSFSKIEDLSLPGPNNDVVRSTNNSIDNMRKGSISPNNEIVKFANGIGEGLNSVSQGVTHLFH